MTQLLPHRWGVLLAILVAFQMACLPGDDIRVLDGDVVDGEVVDGQAEDVFDGGFEDTPIMDLQVEDVPSDVRPDSRPDADLFDEATRSCSLWADAPTGPCANRRIRRLRQSSGLLSELAIALSHDYLGVAVSESAGPDSGSLVVGRLARDTGEFEVLQEIPGSLGTRICAGVAMATDTRERFHILCREQTRTTSLTYRRIGTTGVEPREVAAASISRNGDIDLLVTRAGLVHAIYIDQRDGRFVARTRTPDGWGTEKLVTTDASITSHWGGVALSEDPTGRVFGAIEFTISRLNSRPQQISLQPTGWRAGQVLDNNTGGSLSGIGVDYVASAELHYAAYLDWQAGSAEIRLATGLFDTAPSLTVVQSFAMPESYSRIPLKLAIDDRGRPHIVVAVPFGVGRSVLEWHRRTGPGGTWLVDLIDDDLPSLGDRPAMDFVLDERGLPHIVYGRANAVYYATITE